MSDPSNQAKAIFLAAIEGYAPEQWPSFLDDACAGNATLRAEVEKLLQARSDLGSFHEAARPALPATVDSHLLGPDGRRDNLPTSLPLPEGPGTVVGPYKLLQQIGEGGMGTVFLAEQMHPVRRRVALKVIKPGMDSQQVLARFEAERQALALMDHPNIAKVLDAGATEMGRPYFVMELVKGLPITRYCDEQRLSVPERLRLFVSVCQAVQHAHQKGIIHRDLKPANVLVGLYDGVPVVKVIDFGVAKAVGQPLTERTLATGFGAVVGTPEYMSPEQARLDNLDVDTRSDVYALGVLLYELLTGTTPLTRQRVKAAALLEVLRLVREEESPRPSARLSTTAELPAIAASRGVEPGRLSGLVRGELDWVAMRALEKDRNRRYESANSLALEVERYLADEPVLACPPSAAYRLRKFARRHRAGVAVAGVVVAGLLLTLIGLAISTALIWQALEREQLSSYWQRIALADREWSANNVRQAQELLALCPEKYRGWEWHYLKRLPGKALDPLPHDHPLRRVVVSPDGKRIVTTDFGGFVKIWDLATGKPIDSFQSRNKPLNHLAYSSDGEYFATADADYTRQGNSEVRVWNARTGEIVAKWENAGSGSSALAFSPDGKLACSQRRKAGGVELAIVDPMTGEELIEFDGPDASANHLAFTPDGKLLAETTWGGKVRLWDVHSGKCVRTLYEGERLDALALSKDGRFLAAATEEKAEKGGSEVLVWEVRTGQQKLGLGGLVARCLAFSPDGTRLATGDRDGNVKIWDMATGHDILTLRGHFDHVRSLAFSPDGYRLVSAGDDWKILVWDARPLRAGEKIGQELVTLTGHGKSVHAVAFHPEEPLLATGGADGTARLWETRTGREERTIGWGLKKVDTVAFAPGGKLLAAGTPGKLVTVLDTTSGQVVRTVPGHGGWLQKIVFSPDGKTMATASNDAAVFLHDAVTGDVVGKLPGHGRSISDVAFHPDPDKHLLVSTDTMAGTVRVWSTKTHTEAPTPPLRHQALTSGVSFSPDGKLLATGGLDHTIRVWDTTTWKQEDQWRDQTGGVNCLAFSPTDGRLIAWGSTDSTVKVWQRDSGEVVTLRGHTDAVLGIAFSPDGTRIASGSGDGTARIWETPKLP